MQRRLLLPLLRQITLSRSLVCLAAFSLILIATNGLASNANQNVDGKNTQRTSARTRAFDRYFHQLLEEKKIPGAAYVIVDNGRIVAMNTYGVRAKGKTGKVNIHTVFRLASLSKTFASSAAALLRREQKFNWSDKVVRYVPELHFKTPGLSTQLEVEHLLSHSSGLAPNAYDNYLEDNQPLNKILPRFSTIDPHCKPGSCYSYQNVLFSLIEVVIHKATGATYERQLKKRFFTPLKMTDASLGWDGFMASVNRAAPHVQTGRGWRPVKVERQYYLAAPAAGVNASIADMAQWLKAQMGYYPNILPSAVIADITLERVQTKQHMRRRIWRDYISHAGYGLGWRIYTVGNDRIIFHGGWVAGFRAAVAYSERQKVGIAILINAESQVISDLTANFMRDVVGYKELVQTGN
ncbi:MAG: beta-lactamase family protein [Gammaproteobacteria bacterium]|nr:beta-lactamase family protein [Gammaproteobacteria bacterium]